MCKALLVKQISILERSARRVPSQNVSSRISLSEAIAVGRDLLSGENIRVRENSALVSDSANSVEFSSKDKHSLFLILVRDLAKDGMRLYTLFRPNLRIGAENR